MKRIASYLLYMLCFGLCAQQNFLDTFTWTVGQGSTSDYYQNGTDSENIREIQIGPYGDDVVVWKAVPDGGNDADGGWETNWYPIEANKSYRFTIWLKKENSLSGRTYFGLYSKAGSTNPEFIDISDGSGSNYFFGEWLPELGKWYLAVGYLHNDTYDGTVDLGGIYEMNGTKVINLSDLKFTSAMEEIRLFNLHNYSNGTVSRQYTYQPTWYEVNGLEPSIDQLLGLSSTSDNGGSAVWTENNTVASYPGKVQVGAASIPSDYAMSVDGKLITEEVKVQISDNGAWPDYVFTKDYDLPSLEEIQKHIQEKGHLPNIPSAQEVESNGIEVGEMNRLLLEKIEEQMLYILKLNEEVDQLKGEIKNLKK